MIWHLAIRRRPKGWWYPICMTIEEVRLYRQSIFGYTLVRGRVTCPDCLRMMGPGV